MKTNGFTPTQYAMLQVLADGLPHRREELFACLKYDDGTFRAVSRQLVDIRKALRPKGQTIVCEIVHRQIHYRQVRLLHSATDGKY